MDHFYSVEESQISPETPTTGFCPSSRLPCERPSSCSRPNFYSMQCSQGTLSTCPTARTSPYNVRELASILSEDGDAGMAKYFSHAADMPAGGCINDLPDNVKIVFNVGGKAHWCTVATLRGGAGALFPEDEDCFFKKLLQQPWAANLEYRDGAVRCNIDRNGKCFPYILDYVRRGALTSTDDKGLLDMIAFEADFYGLNRLRTSAEARLASVQNREEQILAIGNNLGHFVARVAAIEQRAFMPSLNSIRNKQASLYSDIPFYQHAPVVSPRSWDTDSAPHWSAHSCSRPAAVSVDGFFPETPSPAAASHSVDLSRTPCAGENGTFVQNRVSLINDDPDEEPEGASLDVLCKFYSQAKTFATDEDF
eukprot:Gregarina_sp_Poly_1__10370@NODE_740_length_6512_cov_91_798759_g551_i0_p2_GENE_NODE_740_length_6512_cov_91_798759_g551_i0NODE_740_length_6512_cov_91_798759_g551_i0_p2_ORF_typecomplete_len366_score48_84BTB_2/PF02214_22/4_6e13_NODE_740_length_6512_cov_91_798759_g551_i017632860